MAKKEEKTNVMRTLDQKKIAYIPHAYDPDGPIDGVSVARTLGQDPACVFKTLVTRGASGGYYVFDIPAAEPCSSSHQSTSPSSSRRQPRRSCCP